VDDRLRERVGLNEAAYRNVNEGIDRTARSEGLIGFLCECGRLGCNVVVELTSAEYQAVRTNARRFFLVDGHEMPETEDVVERHERFTVVEKHSDVAPLAERTDPRS
jgi:hypothetical protein